MFVLGYVVLSIAWYVINKAANAGSGGWNSGFECFEFTPAGPADCNYDNWNPLSRLAIILIAVACLAASVACFWFLARRLLRPLRDAADDVRRVGPQNLGQRIAITGAGDEFRELADALNVALDRVAAGYESQRRFASNASHELRTPLAVQRLLTEVAMDDPAASQDLRRLGELLLRTNERNERLIEGLLVLAESDRGLTGKVPVRVDELAATVLDSHLEMATRHEVVLRRDLAECLVPSDPVLLERLLGNLVSNAIIYNQPGGWVEVVVTGEPAIIVRNTGQRVPAEAVPSLFEPFRRLTVDRTDHSGGAGLGLSIVRSIAVAHGGTVDAQPRDDGGLTVRVSFPSA
jgi:signal transduction histidine kinase